MDTVFTQLGEYVVGNQVLFSAAKRVFVSYGSGVRSVRVYVQCCVQVVFDGLLLILPVLQ
jgi:hypothetical protein